MSDEHSLHGRFLMGLDSAAEYERRLARLRRLEREQDDHQPSSDLPDPEGAQREHAPPKDDVGGDRPEGER